MPDLFAGFRTLPSYGLAALALLLLYAIQSEIRFGARARSHAASAADRGSSLIVSIAAIVPVAGFVLAMKAGTLTWIPDWFRSASLPGMPAVAWIGVLAAVLGIATRLWALLTLRERYTRTLLTHAQHAIERGGPYRWIRHPGYLGSLLTLNGVAIATGNAVVSFASLAVTIAAYLYRIRVEDEMLAGAFGETHAEYRRDVGALIPFVRQLGARKSA
jgi:protein-S-isoprenylcysteine O-methyltransferase Ste14